MSKGKRIARNERKSRRGLAFTVVIFIMLALAGGWVLWAHFVKPPLHGTDSPEAAVGAMPDGMEAADGKVTMLIAGGNDNYNTDTIMAVTIHLEEKKAGIVSIPRDSFVNASNRSVKKINSAYGAAKKSGDPDADKHTGFDALRQEVHGLIGFTPRYYIGVDVEGFIELVDLIGGIEYDVPMDMKRSGSEPIDLKKGRQTLTGEQCLMLVRWRGYSGNEFENTDGKNLNSDFGRMYTQQEFLKEVARQTKNSVSISNIKDLLEIGAARLYTNLKPGELLWLAQALGDWSKSSTDAIQADTLPGETVRHPSAHAKQAYNFSGGWYVQPIPDKALEVVNELINPFNMPITEDMVEYINIK
ncbi:MAG: LCP family protein [Oscillospiraceae bacterium]|nr:LCP family protein [Oscillospiraceae bacterium]